MDLCQLCLGKNKIQAGENLIILCDLRRVFRHLIAQIRQDHLDLCFFLQESFLQVIVQLYHRHGLDEECGAGGGLVVDHAWHLVFVLCLYRQTVAVAPHGDHRVLQIGAGGGAV